GSLQSYGESTHARALRAARRTALPAAAARAELDQAHNNSRRRLYKSAPECSVRYRRAWLIRLPDEAAACHRFPEELDALAPHALDAVGCAFERQRRSGDPTWRALVSSVKV